MKLAISYVRFSDPKQSEGDSIIRQKRDFARFCDTHSLSPYHEVFTDEGRSGYHGRHMEAKLGVLIGMAEEKRFPKGTVLVVEAWDRLGRLRPDKQVALVSRILRAGLDVGVFRLNDIFTESDMGTHKWIHLSMFTQLAHQESLQKEERARSAWSGKRLLASEEKRPMSSSCPAWIRLDGSAYALIPDRVAVVRRMLTLAIDGYGLAKICGVLNDAKLPTFGRSKHWAKSYVHEVLRSRALVGEYQPRVRVGRKEVNQGDPIPHYYPAVLTETEFARLQNALTSRKCDTAPSTHGMGSLFSGMVYEGGMPMHLTSTQNKQGYVYAYLSVNAGGRLGLKGTKPINYQHFETVILRYLTEVTASDLTGEPVRDDLADLEARLLERKTRLHQVEELLNAPEAPFELLLRQAARVDAEVKDLTSQIEEIKARRSAGSEGTLSGAKSTILALIVADDEEIPQMRVRLKARIRELVHRFDVTVTTGKPKRVEILVHFKAGGIRKLWFTSSRSGLEDHGISH